MRVRAHSNRAKAGAVAVAALVAIGAVTLVTGNSAQAATARPGDGTTAPTAGASCWGIKQQHPSSPDGLYWLNTVALERPQQFHCDMTTNGGGWVLVGRGREGWTFNPFGQGSPATVRTTVSGSGAFSPAALPASTIDALLNGTKVNALTDGVRLERATNTSGSNRQSYSLFPKYERWTWSFAAGQLLNKVVIDGTTYNGSNTYDTAASVAGQTTNGLNNVQGTRRMFTFPWSSHNNKAGFSFGSGVSGGSNSATNHLWTNGNEGSPIPFTRVWIRPRVANDAAGFSPLPAAGFAAETKPATLKNRSELAPWGVVGLNNTDEPLIEPYYTNVLAVEAGNGRTFVGGRFTGVQNGPSASPVSQRSLAAFDLDGNWISTFRPTVAGRVWDLELTPDNKLLVAGDFTNINGAPNTSGLAALDPVTGEVISSWKATFANTNGRTLVRTLDIKDGTVYAAGTFNRVTAGTWNQITVANAVSLNVANANPGTWRPRLTGQGVDVKATRDGSRVLLGGYFNAVNADSNHGYFAITDAATGNPVPGIGPWVPSVGSNAKYQQAVNDFGDGRVFTGGSEHNIQVWNSNRTQLLDAAVTKQGGDTQAMELFDGKGYVACHCGNWVYEGTNNWTSPSGFRSVQPINLIAAWDAATWQYDTSWYPSSLKGSRGEGVWAIDQDSRGCLWVGGDLNRGGWSGVAANDWLGGFARFCQEDTTAPTTPTNLTSSTQGSNIVLNWGASADASGTVSYDVYKDDRVIATVWGRSYTDVDVTGSHRYTVRASDARGNRSASPAPISVNGPSPVIGEAIAFGSTWKYLDDGSEPGTAWRAAAFNDAAWPAGPGKLGWGRPDVKTTVGATKPNTVYFRRTFNVADPAQVKLLDLQLSVATGAVAYINGVEVGRDNMPAGKVTQSSPAAGYISGTAETSLKSIKVPGSLLKAGTNSIAVEVHNMTPGASRLFFDLSATAYAANGDGTAPSAPTLSAAANGAGRIDLTWTAAGDDVALGGYVVLRDGQVLAVTGPASAGYVDGEVDTAAPHTYSVRAFDTNGNVASSNTVQVGVAADPNLLPLGSSWKWHYAEGGQAAGWQGEAFDDSTWATGVGEFGYGDSDEKTLISTSPTPRPMTAYFRTTIQVPDPAAFSAVIASLIRDDGAVVYVNGVEVGRDNLPAGIIEPSTPSSTIISDRAAERAPVQFTIPASAFKPGANVIAVEVHNSDRWSGDLSFDLRLTGQP